MHGLRVVSFESRRRRKAASLIRRCGGVPEVVAALRRVPLGGIRRLTDRLLAGDVDVLILLTGLGARALLRRSSLRRLLRRVRIVVRGPKPLAALREAGISPAIIVAEPSTTRDVLKALRHLPLKGKYVAVQESGTPDIGFLTALERRGAHVIRLPLYRWTLPADAGPLWNAVRNIAHRRADVVLFTNSNQVANVFQAAQDIGVSQALRSALGRVTVGSIGPSCTASLARFGVKPDVEPSHPRLENLVRETAVLSASILRRKQNLTVAISKNGRRSVVGPREPLFLRACRREPVERTPIWLMRQAGRYMENYRRLRSKVSMLELCKHPDLVAEVTVDAVRRLKVDAAILFSDLLLVAEPLGFRLEYASGEGPVLRPAIRRARDVERLRWVDVASDLGFVAEAVRKTRAALPPEVPLIGFAGAPFTVASYLIEGGGTRQFSRTKSFMYQEPASWHRLLKRLVSCLADYLELQIDAGAQAVQVFDSWVGCLSPADYKIYVQPHVRALFGRIRGRVPTIHFGTQTAGLLELMREAGGTVMGFDWRIGLEEAWARVGRDVAVMGNLDPAALFSSPKEIRAQAARVLKQAGGRAGHIFNLGHGILPETPVENVRALVEAVKELSAR